MRTASKVLPILFALPIASGQGDSLYVPFCCLCVPSGCTSDSYPIWGWTTAQFVVWKVTGQRWEMAYEGMHTCLSHLQVSYGSLILWLLLPLQLICSLIWLLQTFLFVLFWALNYWNIDSFVPFCMSCWTLPLCDSVLHCWPRSLGPLHFTSCWIRTWDLCQC